MDREEAKRKVIDILLTDQNPNAKFYADLFKQYNYGDPEMTPISPIKMGNVNSRHNVVITEEAYKDLMRIRTITEQTNNEVAFILLGEEKENGTVWLDTVLSTFEASQRTKASFEGINKYLSQYIAKIAKLDYKKMKKQIICHGHTHGTSPVSDNFSFGDLISYIQFNNLHPLFANRQIETMAVLLPPSGDFNFIMYENNPIYEGFYTFPTVYLRYNDGRAEKLPAYQNGNYLVDKNKHK